LKPTCRACPALPGALFAAALCAAALGIYAHGGAQAWAALPVWLAGAAAVGVPGALLTRRAARGAAGPVRFAAAVTAGALALALAAAAAGALHARWILPAWVLGCAAALAARTAAGHRAGRGEKAAAVRGFARSADAAVLAALWGVFTALNALWAVRYAHPTAVGALVPNQDFFWNLGNAESLLRGFPPMDLRVGGTVLHYHFLTELFEAALALLTGLPIYDITAFYAYGLIAAGMVGSLYALGRVLWDGPAQTAAGAPVHGRALVLAAAPLWLCGASLWKMLAGDSRFGNGFALHCISNLNGQATALIFLSLFFVFWTLLCRRGLKAGAALWAGAAAAFYLAAFAKSPQAALLACAVAAGLAVSVQSRAVGKKGAALALVLFPAGFAALYAFYFSAGGADSMHFSLTGTLRAHFFSSILAALQARFPAAWGVFLPLLALAQTFLMAPAASALWAAAGLRDIRRLRACPPVRLVWHAAAVGGMLAYYLFDHYSASQSYFANLALFCMALAGLDALPELRAAARAAAPRRKRLLRAAKACWRALAAVSLCTLLFLTVYLGRDAALRWNGGAADANHIPLTAGEEQGCRWLAAHRAANSCFATNRMHTGAAQEGLSNVYTGLSGCPAYLESFKYAGTGKNLTAAELKTRYARMQQLFAADTTPAQARRICAECGISRVVFCPAEPGSDAPLQGMKVVFENESIRIYQVSG
jgi:hypothetical protein